MWVKINDEELLNLDWVSRITLRTRKVAGDYIYEIEACIEPSDRDVLIERTSSWRRAKRRFTLLSDILLAQVLKEQRAPRKANP